MKPSDRVTPAGVAAVVGLVLLLASPALAVGQWYSTRAPLETLAWFDAHRAPGDSAVYASALYHASHARAANARRWHPTGYATLGVAGTLAGLLLLLAGRRGRGGTDGRSA